MTSRILENDDLETAPQKDRGGNGNSGNKISGTNPSNRPGDSHELNKLRKLIVNSDEVGEVLPAAVNKSKRKDNQLANATLPLVEENIRQSIARDPKVLAEALFPAIGPAIRKAIAQALSSMEESLNQTLEHSISPKGLRWRIEAFRTGKSFAEVVMLKTMLYRVEQVFLIHKKTGLLLQHAVANSKDAQDADMVSAMLTASEDFVEDSFKTPDGATLDSLKVKELSVWIEHSPNAVIAGVIWGSPPLRLRETFSETIEQIELNFEDELRNFEGEADVFNEASPLLEKCLKFQANEDEEKGPAIKLSTIAGVLFLGVLIAGAVYFGWEYWRWSRLISSLNSEPGIVLTETDYGLFTHSISGIRDPLARDPALIQSAIGFEENDIVYNWRLYADADQAFVLKRAEKQLKPPPDVTLSINDEILTADGPATPEWYAESARLAPMLGGVSGFRIGEKGYQVLRQNIESQGIEFSCNTADYAVDQDSAFDQIAKNLDTILGSGRNVRLLIQGHASEPGDVETNLRFSKLRAEKVLNDLVSRSGSISSEYKNNPGFLTAGAEKSSSDGCKVTFEVLSTK